MVKTALKAAEAAAGEGKSLEVIDLRTLSPLDMGPVFDSVRRTGRAVVAHEAHVNLGMGAEVAARITEECFYSLEAPVLRVGGFDTPYPPSRIEEDFLPDLDRVLDAVDRTLDLLRRTDPMAEFKLPDVGEGLTEAEIVTWKVKVGDIVAINDIVVEIETAKSLVELPSPYAGTVQALLVPEGETVPVGTPIIAIGDAAPRRQRRPRRRRRPTESDPYLGMAEKAGAAGRAGEIDLSNPAASGGGEGETLVGRNKADRGARSAAPRKRRPRPRPRRRARPPSCSCRAPFEPGERPSPTWSTADEPAVPATSAPRPSPARRRARAGQAAGAQAGQGPRRRPATLDADRARTARSPATTSQAAAAGADVVRAGCCGDHVVRRPGRASGETGASRSRASAR